MAETIGPKTFVLAFGLRHDTGDKKVFHGR